MYGREREREGREPWWGAGSKACTPHPHPHDDDQNDVGRVKDRARHQATQDTKIQLLHHIDRVQWEALSYRPFPPHVLATAPSPTSSYKYCPHYDKWQQHCLGGGRPRNSGRRPSLMPSIQNDVEINIPHITDPFEMQRRKRQIRAPNSFRRWRRRRRLGYSYRRLTTTFREMRFMPNVWKIR